MSKSEPIHIALPTISSDNASLDAESSVRTRYSQAAKAQEPALCCPVDYAAEYLEVIPQEVIERDYGCGDPSKYVMRGETVLDLGSGGGKICFIASQVVGSEGRVIGVDMNDDMLELARRSQKTVAQRIGYDNITFHKGKIQDLALDRDKLDAYLREHPVRSETDLQRMESHAREMRTRAPMIADMSIDVVVSNCVLNLVDTAEKGRMFEELFRVLKPGGRAVISDIVSDDLVPESMRRDPELWSGCISGAFQEAEFLQYFSDAGFCGLRVVELALEPWRVVEGIEFRSMTVVAHKPSEPEEEDSTRSVIYRGPFAAVMDDWGQEYARGQRVAVDESRLASLSRQPFADHFVMIDGEAPEPHMHDQSCGPGCC